MEDFSAESATSNQNLANVRKQLSFAVSNGSCDVTAALNSGAYVKELLEMHEAVKNYGGFINEGDYATSFKFLLDCSLKPEKAAKKYIQCQKWRASCLPLGYVPENEVISFLAKETMGMAGKSRHGWPVLVIFACKDQGKTNHEGAKRCTIYVLEKAMACGARNGRMIVILDLKSAGFKMFDVNQLVLGLQIQQRYYPGILGKLYIVNSPKLVINAWKLAAPLLSKSTKDTIVFLENHGMTDALLSDMNAEVVPEMYGGKGEIVWLQNVRVPKSG